MDAGGGRAGLEEACGKRHRQRKPAPTAPVRARLASPAKWTAASRADASAVEAGAHRILPARLVEEENAHLSGTRQVLRCFDR